MTHGALLTRSTMATQLRSLGVRAGDTLMFHTRMRSLGHVVGGADAVILALQDTVGPQGTLMVVTSWADNTYELDAWDPATRQAYLDEMPAFDPLVSSSDPDVGRLPERLRTWPGALRSAHPESSMAALGARAAWLVHPHDGTVDGFGAGTPLARLVECGGRVLMLGAPLSTITLLHHAETVAQAGPKIRVHYPMPVLGDGQRVWKNYSDINSNTGAYDYARFVPQDVDPFEFLGNLAVDAGLARVGAVGEATCHLFDAASLVRFAVEWLETHFPSPA